MDILNLIISIAAVFWGIFFATSIFQKMVAFCLAIISLCFGYLLLERQEAGYFYNSIGTMENSYGKIPKSTEMAIIVGHKPKSITFRFKLAWEDKVIAEGIELGPLIKSDERRIDGKLFKIDLLSRHKDCFIIKIVNETERPIACSWIAKYNIVGDFFSKKLIK